MPTSRDAELVWVRDGIEKTQLAYELVYRSAIDPAVRMVAVALVKTAPRDDHRERLARLHRFVRDSVDYHREAIETFQPPAVTLEEGGDCDDHVILLGALAWSIRYPFILEPVGPLEDPDHYTIRLGYPPSDSPHGDKHTIWLQCETTIDALFGESLGAAKRRLGHLYDGGCSCR